MNWSDLAAEFAARRKRLRTVLTDWRASLLEFAVLAGVLIGSASPAFGPKQFAGLYVAPLLPLLAVLGYLRLEQERQRALAAGMAEEAVRARSDRRALAFLVAVAVIGYALFVWARLAPPPFELAPSEPPTRSLDVELSPG